MQGKVLVTDGEYRHTLALIRAISGDYEVHVGSEGHRACCFYSRFVSGRMLYSLKSPESFASSINKYIHNAKIDTLIPVGDTCCFFASLLKDKIDALVPVADIESMRIVRNKVEMHDRARKVGFNVPKILDTPDCFPVVLRPVSGRGNLRFVNNKKEFEEAKKFFVSKKIPFFVTEYIDGEENYSFAGLFREGKLKVFFMYREIREYPLTGGSATYAVSTYDAEIKSRCQKLLEDLKWHGVAMVEFKINSKGEMYFMEVNPKFWASLELAIACGVNFPLLLLKMYKDEIEQPKYPVGVQFRWLLEDFLNFLSKPNMEFIKCFFEKNIVDIHPDDLPAHVFRVFRNFQRIYKAKKRLKKQFILGYPYGVPAKK